MTRSEPDPLSVIFRENILRLKDAADMSVHRFGVALFGPDGADQVRTQLVGRPHMGFTLSTVHRYASRLGVDASDLLDPRWEVDRHVWRLSESMRKEWEHAD